MFNIGDEDKEKLKDNMDEIKNLINKEGENPQSQNQNDSQFQQVSQQQETNLDNNQSKQEQKNELEEELESSLQDLDQKEQQTPESNLNQQNNSQNNNQFGQESFNNENLEKNNNQQQNNEFADQESNPQGQNSNENFNTQQGSNNPSQSKEQPNFSGNSLFLRVERFRNIEGLVSQMRDLTNQIDQQIGDLERTNEEDREIKEETHKILSEFSSRRQEMEESLMKNN